VSRIEDYKEEVIRRLEELIQKGEEIFLIKSEPKLRYIMPEHISGPIRESLETVRIIRTLKNAKNKIEGGERKWEENTR
jgi:alkyl hydroperoxide reductase subunit AhpC